MAEKNCQNCKRVIGNLEESYSYYGQTFCKACMVRLEKLLGDTGTTDNIETEASTQREHSEQESDVQHKIPEIVEQATYNLEKDSEHTEEETSSGEIDKNSTKKILKLAWLVAIIICLAIIVTTIYVKLKGMKQ